MSVMLFSSVSGELRSTRKLRSVSEFRSALIARSSNVATIFRSFELRAFGHSAIQRGTFFQRAQA